MNEIDKSLSEEFGKDVYRNKYDKDGKQARAAYKSEDLFEASAFKYYGKVKPATEEENVKGHIDFHVETVGSVDVKSKKSTFINGLIWIEIQNVVGNHGWLYGDADYIAFEWDDHFKLCPTQWLQLNVAKWTARATEVTWREHALYNHYTRKKFGRDDILTLVTMEDILFTSELTVPFCREIDLANLLEENRSKS